VITAIDTSVLLDVLAADPSFGQRSADALRLALGEGRAVACDVVWSEVAGFFPSPSGARTALETLGVHFDPVGLEASLAAGAAWKAYRARGGKRDRMLADLLVGAHALGQADRLLTRDRGFYRTYFAKLPVLDPGSL
jgi:predicted nucleic acid-binding protein